MKLIPPDLKRCQSEIKIYSPFDFGIANPKRCENKPLYVITEKKKPNGSMSVCSNCLKVAIKQIGKENFKTRKI
jgi:hypothetical protein